MNCYDFDKTIYKKDSAIQLLIFAMKKNFSVFFYTIKIVFLHFCIFVNLLKLKNLKKFILDF